MYLSLRTVAWEPRIPFSELPLESLMLLELLLREFINCELHGQQGVAVGVGCVRVKREVCVCGPAVNCQCVTRNNSRSPQQVALGLPVGPNHSCLTRSGIMLSLS